jgi:hypothetical protein
MLGPVPAALDISHVSLGRLATQAEPTGGLTITCYRMAYSDYPVPRVTAPVPTANRRSTSTSPGCKVCRTQRSSSTGTPITCRSDPRLASLNTLLPTTHRRSVQTGRLPLVYYIIGDNGASAEGTLNGAYNVSQPNF